MLKLMKRTEELKGIISSAVFMGILQYRHMISPGTDRISQRQAKRYLSQLGYKGSLLDKWAANKLLHRIKGEGKNASVYYSAEEIQKMIMAIRVEEYENC